MTKETREFYKDNFKRECNPYEKQISRPLGAGIFLSVYEKASLVDTSNVNCV